MGLYLCVFNENGDDIDGVEVGSYADYGHLTATIAQNLEGGVRGSRFPVFMLHSDSDGEWSCAEIVALERELLEIRNGLSQLGPEEMPSGWQREVSKLTGHRPKNLNECFIDVDGELLLDRLIDLARLAQASKRPITFQ